MKKPQVLAAATAGTGAAVVVVGGAITQSSPEVFESVRAVGLLLMLVGAGIFLLANYARRRPSSIASRLSASSGIQETGRNLTIVGATFFLSAMALALGLRWILDLSSLAFWILGAIAVLGALATVAGGLMYLGAAALGRDESAQSRGDSP